MMMMVRDFLLMVVYSSVVFRKASFVVVGFGCVWTLRGRKKERKEGK